MENYYLIKEQRKEIIAAVDKIGCYSIGKDLSGDIKKFTILTSLLLSSQTKDEVTYNAVMNLKKLLINITPENVLAAKKEQVHKCISKVGYHNKKLNYLLEISQRTRNKIPDTLDEILKLPGIGKKMAYLYMYYALDINIGVSVDTHVHRIANRIMLAKTKNPESTRLALENIFDIEEYPNINKTLVGFGQSICLPINPKCSDCIIYKLCPSSTFLKK